MPGGRACVSEPDSFFASRETRAEMQAISGQFARGTRQHFAMKERTIHQLDSLAVVRDGCWTSHANVPLSWIGSPVVGDSAQLLTEKIFEACHWLRKTGRPMSEKSRTEYGNSLQQAYRQLAELGYALQKPWNLEHKHVEALCRMWSAQGLSASTVQGRLMVLSWWGAVLGRPGLVRGTKLGVMWA